MLHLLIELGKIINTKFLITFMDYFYLSFFTIFQRGYNNIIPIDPIVHLMSVIEIAIGWLLLLVFSNFLVLSIARREQKK